MEFPSDAPVFSLSGTRTCRVISLHDGDTFTAIFRFGDAYYKFSVRLGKIDTCEMTSKNPVIKSKALLARNKLFNLLADKNNVDTLTWKKSDFDDFFRRYPTYVTVNCNEMDKYGRVLVDIKDYADILVKEKLAYWYDGGKKYSEEEICSILQCLQ